jgi:hypothetical protein
MQSNGVNFVMLANKAAQAGLACSMVYLPVAYTACCGNPFS